MNIPFLGKKIKWYNMSDLNETELKKGFFRPNQKFCTDDSKRSNIVVDHLNVTIQHNQILKELFRTGRLPVLSVLRVVESRLCSRA